ncbi:MAG TPA: ribosome biogenesis GTPase Der [Burkholderiales bacterium]|nr:ribosome biogenesis GTPase Der [Burkholderiales bacterium]
MVPTIALVGRPNVGKSTLFNRLTRSRDALVADIPGLTRDRHYGRGRLGTRAFLAVDTGGLEPGARTGIFPAMARQTLQAVAEADAVLFLVDGREGLTSQDRKIAAELRKTGRPLWLVVNKAEGRSRETVAAEFHELGLGDPLPISAAHGDGVHDLLELVLAPFPEEAADGEEARTGFEIAPKIAPKIAVVGRPNVGKSTLVNAMLGEERVIAFDQPGTTRDSIYVDFQRAGKSYTLIDTAGLRRRGKVDETAEKFSVVKTLQAIEDANVVILVLDAQQDIADQDAHIAGFILEAGRALVVAVNKWDAADQDRREAVKREIARKLGFLAFARFHYVSALSGRGTQELLASVDAAYAAAMAKLPTPKLTRALIDAVARQAPPRAGLFRPKLRYAHQGGMNPPTIVIHGNQLDQLPDSYRRYLERVFAETFGLRGTPLRLQFRAGRNPFAKRK